MRLFGVLFLLLGSWKLTAAEPSTAQREALARYGAGLWAMRKELPVQAIQELERARQLDPESLEPLKPLAKLYEELGRPAPAIVICKKILAADPDDVATGRLLARLLDAGKRYSESGQILARAATSREIAHDPIDQRFFHHDAALAFEKAKEFKNALFHWEAAFKILTAHRDVFLREEFYEKPEEVDREAGLAKERIGDALLELKKFPEAEEAYLDAAKLLAAKGVDAHAAARIQWNLGKVRAARGDLPEALKSYRKFLALKPASGEAYDEYAELLRRGKPERLLDALNECATENPRNDELRWLLLVEKARLTPEALRTLRVTAKTESDPRFFTRIVKFYGAARYGNELLTLAEELFTAAKPSDAAKPEEQRAATERARRFVDAVASEPAAEKVILDTIANDWKAGRRKLLTPETLEWISGLAEKRPERLSLYEEALERSAATDADAAERLANHYYRQRQWQKVLETCDRIDKSRNRGGPNLRRITPLAELGRADEALKIVATLGDPIIRAYFECRIHNIAGQFQKAVDIGTRTLPLAKSPKDIRDLRQQIADGYLGLRAFDKAEEQLRVLLEEEPDDVSILNNLGYNLADQGRSLDEAEEMIRRAIALDHEARLQEGNPEAESGVYLDSLAWVLFRKGKIDETKKLLARTTTLPDSAGDGTVWDHYGDVLMRAGEPAEARKAWREAAKLLENSHIGKHQNRRAETIRKLKQTE